MNSTHTSTPLLCTDSAEEPFTMITEEEVSIATEEMVLSGEVTEETVQSEETVRVSQFTFYKFNNSSSQLNCF